MKQNNRKLKPKPIKTPKLKSLVLEKIDSLQSDIISLRLTMAKILAEKLNNLRTDIGKRFKAIDILEDVNNKSTIQLINDTTENREKITSLEGDVKTSKILVVIVCLYFIVQGIFSLIHLIGGY